MRFYAGMFLFLGILLLLIPAAFGRMSPQTAPPAQQEEDIPSPWQQPEEADRQQGGTQAPQQEAREGEPPTQTPQTSADSQYFRILDQSTGEIHTVSVRDYVRGAVCSEMPVTFHEEALKAQAVSAHTYALCLQQQNRRAQEPSLQGADFRADPGNWRVYVTRQQAQERFGGHFEEYWGKICAAADSVIDQLLVYQGEPIAAAYHAISSGSTEAAQQVWGNPVDYLVPAQSPGDLLAPNYQVTVSLPVSQVQQRLEDSLGLALTGEPESWFSVEERSPSGYVTRMRAGDAEITGLEFRQALELRSSHFTLDYVQDSQSFAITTLGYGHGVGLSQYGADYMARQGASWQQILLHYYPGATLADGQDILSGSPA